MKQNTRFVAGETSLTRYPAEYDETIAVIQKLLEANGHSATKAAVIGLALDTLREQVVLRFANTASA
jgi:hypothetical protein